MILKNLFIFAIFSMIGWIIEVIYRSYKNKKFINPGFLTGPAIPLYGFGCVIINSICNIFSKINSDYKILLIVLISMIILTSLELLTGIVMVELFNTKLWDYSNEKYNYQGQICLKFSLAWGILVLLFYLCIYPWLNNFALKLSNSNIALILLGIYYIVFIIDLSFSIDLLSKISKYSKKMQKIINLELFKKESLKENSKMFFDKLYLYKHINNYLKEMKKK